MDLAPGESTGASSAGGAVVVFDVDENQTGNLKKASFSRSSYSGRDCNESESKHDDCSFSAAANSCGDFVFEGVESTLSPLTCDFDESNIKGDHSVNGNKGNCSPTITLDRSLHQCNSIHQDTDSQSIDSEGNNAVMKAEVRLLLHWINGLYEILSDDRQRPFLKKIIFGICRSRSRLREDEGCKHCNGISDRRSKKCEDDEVIESFSFDLSRIDTALAAVNRCCAMDHGAVQQQYRTLFRNLQSFTSLPLPGLSLHCKRDEFEAASIQNSVPKYDIPSCRSRYFTFRVEFSKKCMIPQSLDPLDAINRHANVTNHSSIICEQMKHMIETPLGEVVERNCTGLGVKLVAYNVDVDFDYRGGFKSSFESRPKSTNTDHVEQITSSNKRRKRSQSPAPSIRSSRSESRQPEKYTSSGRGSELSRSSESDSPNISSSHRAGIIIENETKVYAMPCKSSRHRPNQTKLVESGSYIPCQILGHRIKDGRVHYKLLFYDDALNQSRMKKQWLDSNKVMTAYAMKKRIRDEVETMKRNFDIGTSSSTLDGVGGLGRENIVSRILELISLDRASAEQIVDSLHCFDHSDPIKENVFDALILSHQNIPQSSYCVTTNPITVVMGA